MSVTEEKYWITSAGSKFFHIEEARYWDKVEQIEEVLNLGPTFNSVQAEHIAEIIMRNNFEMLEVLADCEQILEEYLNES